ncbi:MAG: TlpA family protein disulfide reductase [Kofleriaceae bacterium]
MTAPGAPTGVDPGWLARIGLAIANPRWALAVASDRRYAGRSGTDLIALIAIVVVATQARALFASGWLASELGLGLGARGVMRVLTQTLTVDLGFLVLGALVLWVGGGPKRHLGRAFDLACVAVVPLLVVQLGATVAVRAIGLEVPRAIGWALSAVSWGWAGALIAIAWRPMRVAPARVASPTPAEIVPARRTGWAVLGVAVLGVAVQVASIARDLESMRPVTDGDPAPAFALRSIGAAGTLGAPVALADHRGEVVVLDFWATWCKPCLAALPKLEAISKRPGVVVIAVNLDDPIAARALFDRLGYQMALLADDGAVSERYNVSAIPHTVVIGRDGIVAHVARGNTSSIARAVDAVLGEQIRN